MKFKGIQRLSCLAASLLVTALVSMGAELFPQRLSSGQINNAVKEGRKAIRAGEYNKAISIYKELLEKSDEAVQAHLGLSFSYLKAQNYQLCYDHANLALRMNPSSARARALAGMALLRSGYVSNAVAELIEAIKLDPKESLAYGAAAEIDYYEGRARESRAKAFQAYALDSQEPDFLITIARASSRLEMFAEAADAYERFLLIAPKTDVERRDRIRGLIAFYRQLSGIEVHQLSGPDFSQIPFQLGSDRRPYIKLKINGRDATFVIDTGSGFTVVSKDAAKRFGVSEIARGGTSQGVGGTGKFPIVYGLIRALQIGDFRIKSVPCFVRPFHGHNERPSDERSDGFIGLSILSHFLAEIDYKDNFIRLFRDKDKPLAEVAPTATVIPFRTTQNGLISVETEIEGIHRINAILDSGASSTVISSAAVDRLQMRDSIIKGQTVRVIGAGGISDNVELLFIKSCRVADLQQSNLRALVLDFDAINETSGFEQSGILGGDFLRNLRITIDFARAQVALTPHSPAVEKK
ncbi:MAG: aspartyl protease family protein [Acidobacteriota bacterium]